jgi:deferrochelatase/peroxidase EfeB
VLLLLYSNVPLTQGAPIDLAPLKDDIALANDPRRNNNFNYTHPGKDFRSNQEDCPFSAHVRKTRPRADLGSPENVPNHIIRAGIPYGPEGMQSSPVQCSESVSDLFYSL